MLRHLAEVELRKGRGWGWWKWEVIGKVCRLSIVGIVVVRI
jgi:hypothetical protein